MKKSINSYRILSIVLFLGFITMGSVGGCSNNNSDGDGNGGGFGKTPTFIFDGGQFGVDYSWTSVSRCRNNRDISMDGCDVNAAFVNNPSAPMPECTGNPNPFCTLDECVACYEVDTMQMSSVGANILRLYSPNYSVTES